MVAVTVVAVASFVRLVVPELGWAAAIALGAIVAPPDTSAAFAVLRKLKPPHHLLVILEGEGLFNDAMALLVYRSAVGVALTGAFSAWGLVPTLLLTCVGGTLAGWLLARIQIVLFARIADIPISILLQFVSTFVVWLLAERLGLSPIITVVAFAMTLARHVPVRIDARHRVATYAVWDVAVLVLNVLAFVLVGLQLGAIIDRVGDGEWRTFAIAAGVVCTTIIAVRIAWIMLYTALDRRWGNMRGTRPILGRRAAVIASWCGMRGIVTLATALALPAAFPYRDLILFCAFCAVLATLVIQGMTVRPLMRLLGLHDDHTVEREVTIARVETSRAALRVFETAGVSSTLRDEYQARVAAAEAGRIEPDVEDTKVALRAVEAQREALTELRARYVIGDHAFHVVEEEIDFMELNAATTR
jgi:CPA1 family monovalent cation:H+ antiporter